MAATESLGVPRIDWSLWAATLAAAVEALLAAPADEIDAIRKYAEIQLREYEAAIKRAMDVQERRDNVIPLRAPVSINSIIDDLGFTPTRSTT